jgi:hypothetical protein
MIAQAGGSDSWSELLSLKTAQIDRSQWLIEQSE